MRREERGVRRRMRRREERGAKIEEIYPPKLQEFAYVTGKFC